MKGFSGLFENDLDKTIYAIEQLNELMYGKPSRNFKVHMFWLDGSMANLQDVTALVNTVVNSGNHWEMNRTPVDKRLLLTITEYITKD